MARAGAEFTQERLDGYLRSSMIVNLVGDKTAIIEKLSEQLGPIQELEINWEETETSMLHASLFYRSVEQKLQSFPTNKTFVLVAPEGKSPTESQQIWLFRSLKAIHEDAERKRMNSNKRSPTYALIVISNTELEKEMSMAGRVVTLQI